MPRTPYQKSIAQNQIYLSKEQEENLFSELISLRKELRELLLSQEETAWYISNTFEDLALENKSPAKLSRYFNSKKAGLNKELRELMTNNEHCLNQALDNKEYDRAIGILLACDFSDEYVLGTVVEGVVLDKEVREEVSKLQERIKGLEETAIRSALASAYEVGSKYKNLTFDLMVEDNMQEANIGLMEAVRLYDPSKGLRFITYAYIKCNHAVRDSLMEGSRQIRLPRNRLDAVFAVASGLKQTTGRVTVGRIKKETNKLLNKRGKPELSKEEVEESLGHLYDPAVRMDERLSDADAQDSRSHTIGDTIQDPNMNPEEKLDYNERFNHMEDMMSACGLEEIEKSVIKIRYMTGDGVVSYRETGDKIHRSGEVVRLIELSAINKLKKQAGSFRFLLNHTTREP